MNDLGQFLLARIAEDEAAATDAGGVPWEVIRGVSASQVLVAPAAIRDERWRLGHLGHVATVQHPHDLDHIVRHDPARVLAECDAKRRIVRNAQSWAGSGSEEQSRDTLHLLALPYADHPDYDETWRP